MCEHRMFSNFVAYVLPRVFYGEQIQLGMEGPFLGDENNDTTNQVTIKLMGGSRPIDVSSFVDECVSNGKIIIERKNFDFNFEFNR